MIDNQEASTQKAQTYSWASFPIKILGEDSPLRVSHGTSTLIGHHLAVFTYGKNERYYEIKLWVVNLQDTRIQKYNKKDKPWGSDSWTNENFSLNTYGENQMIKFGGEKEKFASNELVWMTIDSFYPLRIKSERIIDENAPRVSGHTAAIYQDCLYVFGGRNRGTDNFANNKLWCFDLKQRTWELCQTTGKPPKAREGAKSFVKEDNLYIYGGFARNGQKRVNYAEIFELNLRSMKWTTITQKDPKPGQDSTFFGRFSADFYGDNMLLLKNEKENELDELYCCNRHTLGSWSKIDMPELALIRIIGNSITYKNVLYTFAWKRGDLILAALDLDRFGLAPSRSLEEEHFNSLFMSENESDIAFKVEEKTIFAHKKVLIEKSKFFANLFKSGMIESRLEVIDIDDCEYETFQHFLRFLYCGTINFKKIQIFKLLSLADKYIQEDLHERCVNVLALNLSQKNIYWRNDFARKKGIIVLKNWCMRFFEHGMNYDAIGQFIQYVKGLESQNDPDYETEDRWFTCKAINETLDRMPGILEEAPQKMVNFYEDFLEKKLSMQNIFNFIRKFRYFEGKMPNLRKTVLDFFCTNYELLHQKGSILPTYWHHEEFKTISLKKEEEKQKKNEALIPGDQMTIEAKTVSQAEVNEKENEALVPNDQMIIELKVDSQAEVNQKENEILIQDDNMNIEKVEVNEKENSDSPQRKAIKRMDPTSHSIEEGEESGPILKKTKPSTEN